MEILKDRMLPRKYWKDAEMISDLNVTMHRLFFQHPSHGVIDRDYFRYSSGVQIHDSFNEQGRWLTKIFPWIRRKLYEINIYI